MRKCTSYTMYATVQVVYIECTLTTFPSQEIELLESLKLWLKSSLKITFFDSISFQSLDFVSFFKL